MFLQMLGECAAIEALALLLRKYTIEYVAHQSHEVSMVILQRLQTYLDAHKIPYKVMGHPIAYTAREIAENLYVPAGLFAKVVIVKAECSSS